jgi:hypothetical protein
MTALQEPAPTAQPRRSHANLTTPSTGQSDPTINPGI